MNPTFVLYILAAIVLLIALRKAQLRLQLSRAKHRSLAGHSRWSRRFAALVPFYEYGAAWFFRSDRAPAGVAEQRRSGFERLAQRLQQFLEILAGHVRSSFWRMRQFPTRGATVLTEEVSNSLN